MKKLFALVAASLGFHCFGDDVKFDVEIVDTPKSKPNVYLITFQGERDSNCDIVSRIFETNNAKDRAEQQSSIDDSYKNSDISSMLECMKNLKVGS